MPTDTASAIERVPYEKLAAQPWSCTAIRNRAFRALYIYNEWRREIAGTQVTQVAGGGYN